MIGHFRDLELQNIHEELKENNLHLKCMVADCCVSDMLVPKFHSSGASEDLAGKFLHIPSHIGLAIQCSHNTIIVVMTIQSELPNHSIIAPTNRGTFQQPALSRVKVQIHKTQVTITDNTQCSLVDRTQQSHLTCGHS